MLPTKKRTPFSKQQVLTKSKKTCFFPKKGLHSQNNKFLQSPRKTFSKIAGSEVCVSFTCQLSLSKREKRAKQRGKKIGSSFEPTHITAHNSKERSTQ
jgi:peptidase E